MTDAEPEWVKIDEANIDTQEAAINMMTTFESLQPGDLVEIGHGTDATRAIVTVLVRLAGETWVFSPHNARFVADVIDDVAEEHPERFTDAMERFRDGLREAADSGDEWALANRTLQ